MLPKPSMITRGAPPERVEQDVRAVRPATQQKAHSGEMITPEGSLQVSAVFAAAMILSQDLSSLPLILYQRIGTIRRRAWESSYYTLLHDKPNHEQSSMVFRQQIMLDLVLWGNFYGQLIWNEAGEITEIWRLQPERMTVARVDGERVYTYSTPNGQPRVFLADEILHIPGLGFDGLVGKSVIGYARNAIGLSIAAEKYGGKFFDNGAQPGIVIEVPEELSDLSYQHLKESWEEGHKGVENAHKVAVLEGGAKIEKIGMPLDDAQYLQTRKFQVAEIARMFRIPPHMIGDVDRSTSWGSGIDSQEQGYVNHTLRPWATLIEETLRLQVLPEQIWANYYYEHLMDDYLRGDIQTRYEAYVKALNNGVMSHNEVRAKENLNPFKGGDSYWMQANMNRIGGRDAGNGPASLAPLWRDAIGRIVKRETNDLQGALRRFQGNPKRLQAWAKTFYCQDHPAFVRRQLQPILETEQRLFGADRWEEIGARFEAMLAGRLTEVLDTPGDELLAGLEAYAEATIANLMERLAPVSVETPAADDVDEERTVWMPAAGG